MGGSDRYMKQIKSAIRHLDQSEATSQDINIDGVTILTIKRKRNYMVISKNFNLKYHNFVLY